MCKREFGATLQDSNSGTAQIEGESDVSEQPSAATLQVYAAESLAGESSGWRDGDEEGY
jgi:hypothetical protein